MTVWNAVLFGLVHGIAEFFPISGSGHRVIIYNLFKLSDLTEGHMLFDALLRFATLVALLISYWPEICAMYYELLSFANLGPYASQPKDRYPAAKLAFMILLASIPLFFALPFSDDLAKLQSRNVFVGVMLILSGCVLYASDRMTPGRKSVGNMGVFDALIVGLCQAVAVIPGLSHTGVSISAGLAVGFQRGFAVNFAFIMSIPAVFGAMLMSFVSAFGEAIDWHCVPAYLIGTVAAILTGLAAIRVMRAISRQKLGGFAYYCWVVGVLSIILYLIF